MTTIRTASGHVAELRGWRWHSADADTARILNILLGPDGCDPVVLEPPIGEDQEQARARRAVAILGGRIVSSPPGTPPASTDAEGNPLVY